MYHMLQMSHKDVVVAIVSYVYVLINRWAVMYSDAAVMALGYSDVF